MPRIVPESETLSDVRAMSEVEIDDTTVLLGLTGPRSERLKALERELSIECGLRGNTIYLRGSVQAVGLAERFLAEASQLVKSGVEIGAHDVPRAIRMLQSDGNVRLRDMFDDSVALGTGKKPIGPRGLAQKQYVDAIRAHDLTFGIGPAGTGKTYLAVASAVAALLEKRVKRIVLTRPAVEAGEKLGFLPGDLAEKVNPYLRPLLDALEDMMDLDRAQGMMARGQIEIAPLAFMRGRTLNDSFVILDEAQNTTSEQMRMFLTRLGYNSRAVVTGDVTQVDLPDGRTSGLAEARELLSKVEGIAFCEFSAIDVVRHPLVQKIIVAYEERDARTPSPSKRAGPQLYPRRSDPPPTEGPASLMPPTIAAPEKRGKS
jgi:phosphate starvation-inducible PhoH-like protein